MTDASAPGITAGRPGRRGGAALAALVRIAALAALVLGIAPARAAEFVAGPIGAAVVWVYGGNNFTVQVHPWPGMNVITSVSMPGIEVPEVGGTCGSEKALAIRARDFLQASVGRSVTLTNIRPGAAPGYVLADVQAGGRNVADLLLKAGLARPLGAAGPQGWCG